MPGLLVHILLSRIRGSTGIFHHILVQMGDQSTKNSWSAFQSEGDEGMLASSPNQKNKA